MKLIIEIDKKDYEYCKDRAGSGLQSRLEIAVADGTPLTDCTDAISRKAVLSLLHFHRNDDDKIEGYIKTKDILNLPPVTPAVTKE